MRFASLIWWSSLPNRIWLLTERRNRPVAEPSAFRSKPSTRAAKAGSVCARCMIRSYVLKSPVERSERVNGMSWSRWSMPK